ncbi:phosphoenolpyruvate carboxylase, putative [Babesia ovata]|uniref:Phosphoenolpyruvate carboxylase, putative n=1 Tax=Babesia ovata TaxID=189622 RepID=A0A2H6K6L4_9APIC|nr:phosphoenolpyruvate carboxylase, putative [Babesia ovata]GBE58637.1 phosphoenolpyruvate carboxylase, putative [Babesia ovata]
MGAPPTDGNSVSGTSSVKGIAFYAHDAEFYRKVKILESLTRPDRQLYGYLEFMLLVIRDSRASPEIKEADKKECTQLMRDVQNVTSAHGNYAELRKILDKYRAVSRSLQRGHVAPERYAELRSDLEKLEEQFKGNERTAFRTFIFNNASYYRESIRKANSFIRKHAGQTLPSSHDHGLPGVSSGNPPTLGPDSSGDTGGRHSDAPQNTPASDAGNEEMRTLLNDRTLLTRWHKLQATANKIEEILHDPLMNDINLYAAGSPYFLSNAWIPKIQEQYDTNYDTLSDIRHAWHIYERYNDISDELRKVDPKSLKKSELIEEQRRLELAFEEYGTLAHDMYVGYLDWRASNILYMLEQVEGERKKSQSTSTVHKTSRQVPTPLEVTPLQQTVPKEPTISQPNQTNDTKPSPRRRQRNEAMQSPGPKKWNKTVTTPRRAKTYELKPSPLATNQKTSTTEIEETGQPSCEAAEESITCYMHDINDSQKSSGFATMGITVIRTMVAVGAIAMM